MNSLFAVYKKEAFVFEEMLVYDVTYDDCGYPLFLIYEDNQWKRKSAKHFVPVIDESNE